MDGWPWWEVKWNLTSQYKFTIAIENSLSLDYVTEKLFHSFIVGTVPSTCITMTLAGMLADAMCSTSLPGSAQRGGLYAF